jgi:hypothetical protein
MTKEPGNQLNVDNEGTPEIIYNSEKDFYRGMSGELRMKAEGLFKKAKEKGISIEDVNIEVLKESRSEFPGIGALDLPTFIIKVRGRDLSSGQVIVDGKQIDYYNRYQKYVAQKIENKNILKNEEGRVLRENRKPKIKENLDFTLTDWEKFEIGSDLIDDKEFGIEKTITGACDRIIRKLMGENDWLYPEEARLLDEEFNSVQHKIVKEQGVKSVSQAVKKKATDRQINYLKQRVKNMGMDPDNHEVFSEIIKGAGFEVIDINDLSIGEMSNIIDSLNTIIPKVKDALAPKGHVAPINEPAVPEETNFKQ